MIGLLLAFGSIALLVGATLANHSARLRVYEEVFRALGGEPHRVRAGVEGRVHGVLLHYYGGRPRSHAVCHARLAIEKPIFEMDLRPQTRAEERDVEGGRAIDLVLGDASFDEQFIVEAAPAEMARALLDERSRTGLLAFFPCRMTVSGKELHFTKAGTLDEPAEVKRVLELCSRVASRLETLPSVLHEWQLASRGAESGGYRGPSPEQIHALQVTSQGTSAEIETLHRARARRTILAWARMTGIVVLAYAAWLMLGHRC
jgi:hypothetical protein